jgi:hypothetical protein
VVVAGEYPIAVFSGHGPSSSIRKWVAIMLVGGKAEGEKAELMADLSHAIDVLRRRAETLPQYLRVRILLKHRI